MVKREEVAKSQQGQPISQRAKLISAEVGKLERAIQIKKGEASHFEDK